MSTLPFDPTRYKAGQHWEWDTAVPRLKDWGPFLVHQLHPVSERMLELADIQPGSHVLDVATGVVSLLSPPHTALGLQGTSLPPTSPRRWSPSVENEQRS